MNKVINEEVCQLYRGGQSTYQIGRKLNLSVASVNKELRASGISLRSMGEAIKKTYLLGRIPYWKNKKRSCPHLKGNQFALGHPAWNRGKSMSIEQHQRQSKTRKALAKMGKITGYWRGKKLSEQHKQKLREAKKRQFAEGKIPPQVLIRMRGKFKMFGDKHPQWGGGLPKCLDCNKQLKRYEAKRCQSCAGKVNRGENHHGWKGGKPLCKYCKSIVGHYGGKVCRKCWFEYEAKKAWSVKPTKPELIILSFLNKYFPKQWRYVGNGDVWIGGKNPDFININGQKKIIEVYGDYWHRNDNPQDRIDYFKQYGFDTTVIWEQDCYKNENYLLNLINQ